MGILAESKSRRRTISRDPNNSRWMRDTTTFGRKILLAQGWEQGQFLGAQNPATMKLHSQASASCIRVTVKDDVKGLGYNQAAEDKVTGLDVFSDVLSRLNGKSEEDVTKKKQERLVLQSNLYMQQKWGVMRFVKGGLLVGDVPKEEETTREEGREKSEATEKMKKRSKKRKLDEDTDSREREEKKRRKEERRARKAAQESQERQEGSKDKEMMVNGERGCKSEDVETKMEEKRRKKSKAKDKVKGRRLADSTQDDESKEKEKKEGEKEKKEKKEKKRRRKAEAEAETETEATTEAKATEATTTRIPTLRGHRNFVRSRFIAAKRQAMMDTQALNQIFMIKT